MAATNQIDNVLNLIFKGVSPELFPVELQKELIEVLSKSASPDKWSEDITKWRKSVLDNTDEATKASDEVKAFLGEGTTLLRLNALPKINAVSTEFSALLRSNVDNIDVQKILDDGLRGDNSSLSDGDIKAIEDVFTKSLEVRNTTIENVMKDHGVSREDALDAYAKEMAKRYDDADSAKDPLKDDNLKETAKTIDEIKIIKKLSDNFDRRIDEFLKDPETKKLSERDFEEQVETLIKTFNKNNEALLKELGESGNEHFRTKIKGTSDRIFEFHEENIRPRGINAAISDIKEALRISKSRADKISPTNVNGDFPEFNPGVDWGKVKRHIGMVDIDKTILPVPKWWFYPVKSMITRSEGITKPIVQYVDNKLSSLNITDSIRQLNQDVLETVRNGKDPNEIIENFVKTNETALEEFSENMRQLKMHIEASYKTNKELTGSDLAKWTHDLTEEQKTTLLKYVEDMEHMAIDLKAGTIGKNAQEMLGSIKKIESGESRYTYNDYMKSVTGLSRAAETANFSQMRTTGKWLDGSGTAKKHYLTKIERGIDVGYYSNRPRESPPIHLTELIEENTEKAWQDFLKKFTEVDEQGRVYLNLEKEVKPIEAMVTNLTTIAGPALEEYAVLSAKQLSRITQRSLRGDGIDPFPDDANFLASVKKVMSSEYDNNPRTKDFLDKIAHLYKEATEAKRGAPDENLFGISERLIDDNRWTRTLAMDRSYRFWEPYDMFDNPNTFLGRLGVGYPAALQVKGFFQHTLFKGPLTFMTGGRVEMATERSLIDNFKSFYGRKSIWKEDGENYTAPLKRTATRWGSGFTVKDTNGVTNPFKWDWNKKVAIPTAAAGGLYAADYMLDGKGDLDEYADNLLWFNPYKLGYETYQLGDSTYDYVIGDTTPNSDVTAESEGDDKKPKKDAESKGDDKKPKKDAESEGDDKGEEQKVDNRPQWQKDLDAPRAEAASLIAESYVAAGDVKQYLSSNNVDKPGAKELLEAIAKQEKAVLGLQKELNQEGQTQKANHLNDALKYVGKGKSVAQTYLLKLNEVNEDTQRLKAEVEELEKTIKAIDNFNDAKNIDGANGPLTQLKVKTKELQSKENEALNLLNNIREVAKNNADRMDLNADIRYRYGNAHQFDEALKKWGGEQGLPYQWFGKGQSGISSRAGGMLESAWNGVKGVGDWWGDVKSSARTQSDRNMYSMMEAGAGIFASIGLFNFVNNSLFEGKISGVAKWGIIIGIVGAWLGRSGGVSQAMADYPDRFNPSFLQSNGNNYSGNARTTSKGGNGHVPTTSSSLNSGSSSSDDDKKPNVTALISDRNGNSVDHIFYVNGKITTQNHKGSLPKSADDIIVDEKAAEKINFAVQKDINEIKGAMSGKGKNLPNPLKSKVDVVLHSEDKPSQQITVNYTVDDPETADLTRPK